MFVSLLKCFLLCSWAHVCSFLGAVTIICICSPFDPMFILNPSIKLTSHLSHNLHVYKYSLGKHAVSILVLDPEPWGFVCLHVYSPLMSCEQSRCGKTAFNQTPHNKQNIWVVFIDLSYYWSNLQDAVSPATQKKKKHSGLGCMKWQKSRTIRFPTNLQGSKNIYS